MGDARSQKTLARFLAPEAFPGRKVVLPSEEAHHLRDVLRLRPGQEILLLDLRGAEYLGQVEKVSRREVLIRVQRLFRTEEPPRAEITFLLPLLKKDHLAMLVEKAVELWVKRVVLVKTARTVPRAGEGLREKLKRRADQALKQCRRLWPLEIKGPLPLPEAVLEPASRKIFAYEGGGEKIPGEVIRAERLLVFSGPEGGLAPEEVRLLEEAGFESVTLGPSILRAETAAFYLMCLAHHENLLRLEGRQKRAFLV